MFCMKCGCQNEERARHCIQCGNALYAAPPAVQQAPVCPRCGTRNEGQARHCIQCGSPLGAMPGIQGIPGMQAMPGMQGMPAPSDYMVQSVLVTLFCCLPLGIAGIVKSRSVAKAIALGDMAGAKAASDQVKTLLWIGFAVGGVITLFAIIASIAGSR